MEPLNKAQINKAILSFARYFMLFVLFSCVLVYAFFYGLKHQQKGIAADIDDYRQLLNKQQHAYGRADTISRYVAMYNMGKVENDYLLRQYIKKNKNELVSFIGSDSSDGLVTYFLFTQCIDPVLKMRDSLKLISERENEAYRNLSGCIKNTLKNRKRLSAADAGIMRR